jgi:SAM-dependent methyltransferase
MTQNIYDNADFFVGYSRLARSVEGLDGAPEWPTLRALLPELHGLRVVDLGCGFGWFCRWARQHGAAYVLGVDVSAKMLARAKAFATDPAIEYLRGDLETFELPTAAFDLVYSSLAFHYVENLGDLIGRVSRSLVPGGIVVFSAEHPMFTAPIRPGWSIGADGRKAWPVNAYLDEGPRSTDWLTTGVVKQHRTVATYLNLLSACGFSLCRVEEWGPTEEQVAAHPAWAGERQRPPFLLVAARR